MIQTITYQKRSAQVEVRDPQEHQQKAWMQGAFYEAGKNGLLHRIFEKHQGANFLDIGASIGNHSVFFAKVCNAKEVVAFEPYAPSFDHLQQNIELNDLKDIVRPVHAALGESAAMVNVARFGGPGNVGMVKVVPGEGDIVCHTIDTLFDLTFDIRIDVWKIDTEGHGMKVLKGGIKRLQDWKPTIYIECDMLPEFLEVKQFLDALGYRFVKAYNATPTYEFVPA